MYMYILDCFPVNVYSNNIVFPLFCSNYSSIDVFPYVLQCCIQGYRYYYLAGGVHGRFKSQKKKVRLNS